jgi:hypothetical protein
MFNRLNKLKKTKVLNENKYFEESDDEENFKKPQALPDDVDYDPLDDFM